MGRHRNTKIYSIRLNNALVGLRGAEGPDALQVNLVLPGQMLQMLCWLSPLPFKIATRIRRT